VPLARRAATLRPRDPRYAWTLGYYQVRAGDLSGAAATLEALLAVSPGHAETYGLLAEVYARLGRMDEAAALMRRRPGPTR
jgi:Flp pilus assembly protein TadD